MRSTWGRKGSHPVIGIYPPSISPFMGTSNRFANILGVSCIVYVTKPYYPTDPLLSAIDTMDNKLVCLFLWKVAVILCNKDSNRNTHVHIPRCKLRNTRNLRSSHIVPHIPFVTISICPHLLSIGFMLTVKLVKWKDYLRPSPGYRRICVNQKKVGQNEAVCGCNWVCEFIPVHLNFIGTYRTFVTIANWAFTLTLLMIRLFGSCHRDPFSCIPNFATFTFTFNANLSLYLFLS